jgi:O-antigen/teichoic acid export membrane protein
MNRETNIIKNFIIYSIGNFGSKFLGFLLLPFYTFYLSTNDYGYFDLITTTLTMLMPLITFQIVDGLYRYLLEAKSENQKCLIISSSFSIVIRNLLVANLVYILFSLFVSFKFKYLILIQLNVSIINSVWMEIARGLRNNVEYSIAGIMTTGFTMICNIILIVFFNFRVSGLIIANIIAALISISYLETVIKVRKYLYFNFQNNNSQIPKMLLSFSLPLLPNTLGWWIMSVSDRYILNYYQGMAANGIYAVANKFPSLIILVNSIFYLAWQESSISEYNAKDRDEFYSKMFNQFMKLQFTLTFILLAFTKLLMSYMVNSNFSTAWKYVPFLYFSALFSAFSSFYGTGYLSSKQTKGAFTTSVYGALLNILANLLTVPYIGIQGASLSTMAAFLLIWILRVHQTKRYFAINIEMPKLFLLALIAIVLIWFYYIDNFYLQISAMLLSLLIFVIFNQNIIRKSFHLIKYKFAS